MDYEVVLTEDAKADLDNITEYYSSKFFGTHSINKLLKDFENTRMYIRDNPKAFQICNNTKLQEAGYRMIRFSKHKYFLLYRIKGNIVFIDAIFYESQNYERYIK